MRLYSLFILLVVMGIPPCEANSIDNTPVDEFDIDRYMGKWYEIARFDNRYQRNLTDVTAVYSLDENNNITITNRGYNIADCEWREVQGRGETTSTTGQLRVSFFLFFASDYNVMGLGENYEWALVGTKSSKYLWIISRTPSIPDDTLCYIIGLAQKRGYKVDELNIQQRSDVAVK